MQFRFLYIAIWLNCYLNRGRLKNIATKRRKDQGRFHALFAPHKVNYEPYGKLVKMTRKDHTCIMHYPLLMSGEDQKNK